MKDIILSQLGTKLHFKKITAEQLRESASFNVVDDEGNFVAIVVVPASAFKKHQFQALAEQMNAGVKRRDVL